MKHTIYPGVATLVPVIQEFKVNTGAAPSSRPSGLCGFDGRVWPEGDGGGWHLARAELVERVFRVVGVRGSEVERQTVVRAKFNHVGHPVGEVLDKYLLDTLPFAFWDHP